MASALSEEQFMCCICLDFFCQPVSIPCGHNFCLSCIREFWDKAERSECPLCKEGFRRKPELRVNHALADITEGFKRSFQVNSNQVRRPELGQRDRKVEEEGMSGKWDVCPRHGKPLEVYCRTEQAVVCSRCVESQHKGHQTVAVERESKRMRGELREAGSRLLRMIQERTGKVDEIKLSLQLSKRTTEKEMEQSMQGFTALLRSIERSQEELLEELREKQRELEQRGGALLEELEKELADLVMKKSELEQLLDTEDTLHLLQSFHSVACPPRTKDWSQTCIRNDERVGTVRRAMANLEELLRSQERSLCEAELRQIQRYTVDVTFDPRTAAPWLILSSDLKQASLGYQPLSDLVPPSPLRFDSCVCVLGQPGITTGRHYWVVQVGGKTDWDLGVARESINRKGSITVRPDQGFWAVCRRSGGHLSACAGPSIPLVSFRERPQRVGVFVDYEEGLVSFYDTDARFHIYSYTGCTFAETLYPYFNPCLHDDGKNIAPLLICPVGGEVKTSEADVRVGRSSMSGSHRVQSLF
ncbi:E3 ubiquitin-protein ligase TRIM39-like [Electrophorus electricus]|uniref:E3 ubiquitin-protein ligase TRIM39-like n=1 Tax=Electrophorus electricus TaxID=8005 RepID=UPI0015CFE470|nr:E3 ubiquitin-protein ligase TRIM39-like [Electrophorus electricus]